VRTTDLADEPFPTGLLYLTLRASSRARSTPHCAHVLLLACQDPTAHIAVCLALLRLPPTYCGLGRCTLKSSKHHVGPLLSMFAAARGYLILLR